MMNVLIVVKDQRGYVGMHAENMEPDRVSREQGQQSEPLDQSLPTVAPDIRKEGERFLPEPSSTSGPQEPASPPEPLEADLGLKDRVIGRIASFTSRFSPTVAAFLGDKLLSSEQARLAVVKSAAQEDGDRAMTLVQEMNLHKEESIWQIAETLAGKGLDHVLAFVEKLNEERDQEFLERLARIVAAVQPIETMQRLHEFGIEEESRIGRVVSDCIASDVAGCTELVGSLQLRDEVVLDQIAHQVLEIQPELLLEHLQDLASHNPVGMALKVFKENSAAVVTRLAELHLPTNVVADMLREVAFRNPTLVVDNLTIELVPEEKARRDIAVICALSSPGDTAERIQKFSLTQMASQRDVAQTLISQSPRDFSAHIEKLQTLKPLHAELALKSLASGWWQTVPHLEKYELSDRIRDDIALESLERDPVRTFQNLKSISPKDSDIVREVVLRAAHENCEEVLLHLGDLEVSSTGLHREIARIAARTSPIRLARSVGSLNLRTPEDHDDLIEECLRKDWWGTLQVATAFDLSVSKRNSILNRSVARSVMKTAAILGNLQATDSDTLERVVMQYVESRTSEAAGNPSFFSGLSEELKQKAALRMAELNARATAGAIQHFQISDPAARAEVFAVCAARNSREAFSQISNFALDPNALEVHWKKLVDGRDPERVLTLLKEMGAPEGSRLHILAAEAAVKKSARWVARNFKEYGIKSEEDRKQLALRCARRNSSTVLANYRNFELQDNESLLTLAIEVSGGNPARVVKNCRRFKISSIGHEEQILRTCAAHNIKQAVSWAAEQSARSNLLEQPGELKELFRKSLSLKQATNALHVCEYLIKGRGEHPTAERTLAEFDKQLQELMKEGTPPAKYLHLLQKLRGRGLPPSQNMLSTMSHVGESQQGFLLGLLSQSGASFGESLCENLKKIYRKGEAIPRQDQMIIRDVVSGGFRGFSPTSFKKLQEAYAKGTGVGRLLLRQWQDVSRVVLTGLSVPDDLKKDKLFVDFVLAAYRPTGMTRNDVKNYLGSVSDQSKHLSPYRVKSEGYPVQLISLEHVSLKDGKDLDAQKLSQLGLVLHDVANAPVSKKDFLEILFRGGQRASGQIDKTKLLAYLSRNMPGSSFSKRMSVIGQRLLEGENSEKASYQILSQLQELYSSSVESALEVLIPPLIGTEGDDRNEKFIPSAKVLRNVRKMLSLPEDMEIDDGIIAQALILELGKVFRKEEQIVEKELKKFDTGAGSVSGSFRMYLSKSQSAFFGRAGAGLCTARDTWSWNNKDYLQMMMVDESRGRIVGNIQLHVFKNARGEKSVLARVNPVSNFVSKVDKDRLAKEMLRVVQEFAGENDLVPYLPEQGGWHSLTNRGSFAPSLRKFYGRGESTRVQITRGHSVRQIYRMKPVAEVDI